jgi:transcriptional regulator with XRE-family HTH domain
VKGRDLRFEKAVGQRIKILRNQLGWSQKHLADLSDLEQNQIVRIESAKNSATIRMVVAIAKALGVQPFELMRVEFEVKVNSQLEKVERNEIKTTTFVNQLVQSSFLDSPKSVAQVVKHLRSHKLSSSATSAVLKKLVDKKVLKKIPGVVRGRFLYQKLV